MISVSEIVSMKQINQIAKISRPRRIFTSLMVLGLVFFLALVFATVVKSNTANAACPSNTSNLGSSTGSFTIGSTGTYRIWSRIQPDSTTTSNNSYILEIDDSICAIVVGDATIPANTWTWVDYKDGNTSSKINQTLSAGNHTYKIYGRESGVKLDRIIFATDTSCVPTGTGDNCASGTTCTSTKTADINCDNIVSITDLSLLLYNYSKTTSQLSNPRADIVTTGTSAGKVDITDLSALLSQYGT